MKVTKRSRKISNVILWFMIIVLLVGALGLIYKFTDGLQTDFRTFYIVYDDEFIVSQERNMYFLSGTEQCFKVKYLNKSDYNENSFSVNIYPYCDVKDDFIYKADGIEYLYSDIDDLTDCFDIEVSAEEIIITMPSSMKEVLKKKHSATEIDIDDLYGSGKEFFCMEVSSEDGQTVKVYFGFTYPLVLDKTEIVF